MVRSCSHHVRYNTHDSIECDVKGSVSTTDCSGCSLFQRRFTPKIEPTVITNPAPIFNVSPPQRCKHIGTKLSVADCCGQMFACNFHKGKKCAPVGVAQDPFLSCSTCQDFCPANAVAPRRNEPFENQPWQGGWRRKPWDYRVTVAIPCLDAFDAVESIVGLYRLQSERPFIILIDTGSTDEELSKLKTLAGEDCEVHSLRLNGVKHPSDFPAMAMDVAFSVCRTEYMLATHADCFPTSQSVVSDVLAMCNKETPVVGYELTERPHSDWHGMVGHTLTMFHIPTMDRMNASWSMRRLLTQFKHPDGKNATHEINPATSPNWPDTEILINYQCRQVGITPKIIGTEKNAQRTTDAMIDHCRSWASAKLYSQGSEYAERSNGWLDDGIAKAKQRAIDWAKR